MNLQAWLTGLVVSLALGAAPAEASICQGKSMSLDETVDAITATHGWAAGDFSARMATPFL